MRKAALIIVILAIAAWGYLRTSQEPVPPVPADIAECTSPSLAIASPAAGSQYVAGDTVLITWTGCGIETLRIGLASGGKDFGGFADAVPASSESYAWIAANPARGFTDSGENQYQIVIEGQPGNIIARSETFTVREK